jgi:hypothetical protein
MMKDSNFNLKFQLSFMGRTPLVMAQVSTISRRHRQPGPLHHFSLSPALIARPQALRPWASFDLALFILSHFSNFVICFKIP